jgi:hypothetical protein
MRPRRPPLRRDLPELPRGCKELQATTAPDADTRLRADLDCIPGLGIEEAKLLSRIADESTPSAAADSTVDSSQRVLGLDDLLRTTNDGLHPLHPRVQQVAPVGVLDWLLEAIGKRLDMQTDTLAYQYPHYLLECRGAAPDKTSLHPPQYHIENVDVVRTLRANDILTTVCQHGESPPDSDVLVAAVDSIEARGETVEAVVTMDRDEDDVSAPTDLFVRLDSDLPNLSERELLR